MIGQAESEARAIYDRYDRELPFVRQLAARCQSAAAKQANSSFTMGRVGIGTPGKHRRSLGPRAWGRARAKRRSAASPIPIIPGTVAGSARRTHKAMNALIQGSAARHTKLWMRACWREGIVPLLQMHDALDCSVASPELAERVAQLGREAVTLGGPDAGRPEVWPELGRR